MNQVFGNIFHVDRRRRRRDPAAAAERAAMLSSEFHLRRPDPSRPRHVLVEGILFLREYASGKKPRGGRPGIRPSRPNRRTWKPTSSTSTSGTSFLDSDTKIALLSGFTTDTKENMALSNDQIIMSRDMLNKLAGSRRMIGHETLLPGYPGYLDDMDRGAQHLKIDS